MKKLDGRTAVITGAASGIGRALSLEKAGHERWAEWRHLGEEELKKAGLPEDFEFDGVVDRGPKGIFASNRIPVHRSAGKTGYVDTRIHILRKDPPRTRKQVNRLGRKRSTPVGEKAFHFLYVDPFAKALHPNVAHDHPMREAGREPGFPARN